MVLDRRTSINRQALETAGRLIYTNGNHRCRLYHQLKSTETRSMLAAARNRCRVRERRGKSLNPQPGSDTRNSSSRISHVYLAFPGGARVRTDPVGQSLAKGRSRSLSTKLPAGSICGRTLRFLQPEHKISRWDRTRIHSTPIRHASLYGFLCRLRQSLPAIWRMRYTALNGISKCIFRFGRRYTRHLGGSWHPSQTSRWPARLPRWLQAFCALSLWPECFVAVVPRQGLEGDPSGAKASRPPWCRLSSKRSAPRVDLSFSRNAYLSKDISLPRLTAGSFKPQFPLKWNKMI